MSRSTQKEVSVFLGVHLQGGAMLGIDGFVIHCSHWNLITPKFVGKLVRNLLLDGCLFCLKDVETSCINTFQQYDTPIN